MRPSQTDNFYQRLGVEKSATKQDIKSAYKRLAIRWHPDQNKGQEEMSKLEFIALSEAFDSLYNGDDGLFDYGRQDKYKTENADEDFDKYWNLFKDIVRGNETLRTMSQVIETPELYALFKMFGADLFKGSENSGKKEDDSGEGPAKLDDKFT